jgi:hypothetical protein
MEFDDFKDEDCVVICNPTTMPHVKDVIVQQCCLCGRDVWFAESSRTRVEGQNFYIVCSPCAAPHIKNEVIEMPTDEQLRDAAENLGISFQEAKSRMQEIMDARNEKVKFNKKAEKYEEN